jgi:putative aminopeptidase FrvX
MLKIGPPQLKLLEKLCNAVAVSGDEDEVRQIVRKEVQSYVNDVRVDALGNVLVIKKGSGKMCPRVMLDAHMDEAGFMIVAEDGNGIYRFEKIGRMDERYMVGKQVLVGKDHLPGVIGAKPIHLTKHEELGHKIELDSMRIDLGVTGKAIVGERATFAIRFKRVGPTIMAKSIDNRVGVAVLIELIKNVSANIDLCASFSVQGEIGARGAKVAAHFFDPDLAIIIDSTPARDLPSQNGIENTGYNTKLGLGPAISIMDGSTIYDPRLVQLLQKTAESKGIPYQFLQSGGEDGSSGVIQSALEGIPIASVSVPHRYSHTPISLARIEDWKNTIYLLHEALSNITPTLLNSLHR